MTPVATHSRTITLLSYCWFVQVLVLLFIRLNNILVFLHLFLFINLIWLSFLFVFLSVFVLLTLRLICLMQTSMEFLYNFGVISDISFECFPILILAVSSLQNRLIAGLTITPNDCCLVIVLLRLWSLGCIPIIGLFELKLFAFSPWIIWVILSKCFLQILLVFLVLAQNISLILFLQYFSFYFFQNYILFLQQKINNIRLINLESIKGNPFSQWLQRSWGFLRFIQNLFGYWFPMLI